MLTTGLVTLSQLDAQIVEAREEVEGTQTMPTAIKDNHSKVTSEEEKAPQTTPDTTEKDDSVEKENKGDVTKPTTDKDGEPEKPVTPDNGGEVVDPTSDPEKPVTPTNKTGWDGDSYYIDGEKVISKWLEVTAKDAKDDETTYWYYFDENGLRVTNKWQGAYYLKDNGQMASNEWIFDKDYDNWFFINEDGTYARYTWKGSYYLKQWGEMAKQEWAYSPTTGWHYFNPDGTYVQNKWVGAYYIKQWGYMASNEWIFDKDYDNWFFIKEDGSYARYTWKGSYFLTKWGEMAKDGWAWSPETGWHYFNEDGTYVQNRWVGAYYIKQWGYMAQNEWIWDNNEWYYMTPKTGLMATGWTDVNGDIYYMNANGTIHHGLVYDDERAGWYYFDQKGLLKTGTIDLKDIGITVKTDKEGKISSDVDYLKKINRTIGWFKDREGKVTYSMAKRNGPDSYDCSSSLYNALWNGDFKTRITYAGTTENLYKEKGYLFKEIDARDIRRGDVFI
ncbi:peptidoglycan amidohydrolase family protein, partial [Granulicatella balaenopterae]